MDGGKDGGTHRANSPQMVNETAVDALGIVSVAELRLLGKRVLLQPRQQLQVHGNALVVILCGMDMNVVHSRDEQPVAEVHKLGFATSQGIKAGCHTTDAAVVAYSNVSVLHHFEMIPLRGIDDMSLINCHRRFNGLMLFCVYF